MGKVTSRFHKTNSIKRVREKSIIIVTGTIIDELHRLTVRAGGCIDQHDDKRYQQEVESGRPHFCELAQYVCKHVCYLDLPMRRLEERIISSCYVS